MKRERDGEFCLTTWPICAGRIGAGVKPYFAHLAADFSPLLWFPLSRSRRSWFYRCSIAQSPYSATNCAYQSLTTIPHGVGHSLGGVNRHWGTAAPSDR
jgi:hypothetical protein